MSTIVTAPPTPILTLLDDGASTGLPRKIVFQYLPGDATENMSSAWGSSNALNRENPILQYSNGEQRSFSWSARLWADNNEISIDEQLNAFKLACSRDPDLKRPPRWQLTWGSFIDETVIIQSIGGIRYDPPRPDGTLRGVTLAITFQVNRSVDVSLVAEDRPSDTFFAQTRRGEQWEDIAARHYGDPLLGELLRRLNPSVPFPGAVPGKVVKLSKPENLRNIPVEPDSPPLRRTSEGLALRAAVYEARSVPRESARLKR